MAEATTERAAESGAAGRIPEGRLLRGTAGSARGGQLAPQINLDLATNSAMIQDDLREVVLTVTVSAKQNDKTLFLVEVKQAGAFLMQNLSEEDTKRAIASICPGVLFPYARSMVSQLVSQGGFPQLLLPPVNFDALYLNSQAQSVQPASQLKN